MAKTTDIHTDKRSELFPVIISVKEEMLAILFIVEQSIWGQQVAMTFLGSLWFLLNEKYLKWFLRIVKSVFSHEQMNPYTFKSFCSMLYQLTKSDISSPISVKENVMLIDFQV